MTAPRRARTGLGGSSAGATGGSSLFAPSARSGRTRRPLMIGLTGPIGCGKSTVARILRDAGGTVIDADSLARDVTAPGQPVLAAIRARFGSGVFRDDGTLDRAALARVVFADPRELADLEAIVHPEVRVRLLAAVARAEKDDAPFVVIEAIKLVEGGFAAQCDQVWLIECEPEAQQKRLLGRGVPRDDLERRLRAQGADLVERLAASATRRLATDGTLDEVRERVEDALADVLEPLVWGSDEAEPAGR